MLVKNMNYLFLTFSYFLGRKKNFFPNLHILAGTLFVNSLSCDILIFEFFIVQYILLRFTLK